MFDLVESFRADAVLVDEQGSGGLHVVLEHLQLAGVPVAACVVEGDGEALDLAGDAVAVLRCDVGEVGHELWCLTHAHSVPPTPE